MNDYVQRTLTYRNEKGDIEQASDVAILGAVEPIVVLGEPGMGKTRLLRWIAAMPNWTFRSAAAFVNHPEPKQLVPKGGRLVIDGLDELSAAQESDPVYRVLGQLIKAGCPPFVLSCRAADWRGASARQDIAEEYGVVPREMTLEPFSRDGAVELLAASLGSKRAEDVIAYLEEKGVPDLYGNPLTLSLFAEVAADGRPLPGTRAGLMLRAVEIMWNERNDRHDKSPLSNLDQATALAAAGAASAALILTGSEAISLKPSGIDAPRTVRAAELVSLPDAAHARTLVGSRLFSAIFNAPDQFKPIHRSVAEFLGARWLALSVKDDQARDRILAMMTVDSGVPASLRGIHAWLAQDDRFAAQVISTDPYGVLRYGDADGLTVKQGRLLLQALKALQQSNPYFRAEDWGRHSAKGLTHSELLGDVREILLASDTSFHLRTLLLGIIRSSTLSAALADDLHHIMLTKGRQDFGFTERHEAGLAVAALNRDDLDWSEIVDRLIRLGDEDSTRLALYLMDDVGFEAFAPEQIARTILAHLGLLDNVEAEEAEHGSVGGLLMVASEVPDAQVAPVLDALASLHPTNGRDGDYRTRLELGSLVSRLVARQVALEPPAPLRLLTWLSITPGQQGYTNEEPKRIASYLEKTDDVRRSIQHQLIFVERDSERPWRRIWELGELNQALSLGADDVIHFLRMLGAEENRTNENAGLWRELSAFGQRFDGRVDDILAAAQPFARGHTELEAHLSSLSSPQPKPDWQVKQEKRRRREEAKRAADWAKHRNDFGANEPSLRTGEFQWILPTSQAYLALYHDSNRDLPPPDRIGQWLGADLQAAALAGFEAVLSRTDLPTPEQIADSYSQSSRWNFVFPMIAGVIERLRNGRGLDGVPIDVVIGVRIALQHESLGNQFNEEQVVLQQLDAALRSDPAIHERYARLLVEPSLERRQTHIMGLYGFVRTRADRALATRLAAEWLRRFPDMPVGVEIELIDALSDAGGLQVLREIGHTRKVHGYVDDEQRHNWQAVDLLCDFQVASAALGSVPAEERKFLWHLRHRLRGEERGEQRQVPNVGAVGLAWVVRQFRRLWPKVQRPSGVTSGNTNPWDAAEFIEVLIRRLESDPSNEAASALEDLVTDSEDGYTSTLRHASDRQRGARREINFPGVTLDRLKDVVEGRPPKTTDDLLAVVRYVLRRLQKELHGNDTDTVNKYWRDDGQPRAEDRCTDLLIEDIMRLLPPYGIGRAPQADMPKGKIVDIVFTIGDAALPIESKGQWNRKLWTAAGDQLDAFYLRDWRTQDRGIYLVYWFGPDVESNFKLQTPPGDVASPTTADELRERLSECVASDRRPCISVEVLDFTR